MSSGPYGAMITLALGIGSSLPSIVVGTRPRKSSSWRESTSDLLSYQLPAWLASRVPDCDMFYCGELVVWSSVGAPEVRNFVKTHPQFEEMNVRG